MDYEQSVAAGLGLCLGEGTSGGETDSARSAGSSMPCSRLFVGVLVGVGGVFLVRTMAVVEARVVERDGVERAKFRYQRQGLLFP